MFHCTCWVPSGDGVELYGVVARLRAVKRIVVPSAGVVPGLAARVVPVPAAGVVPVPVGGAGPAGPHGSAADGVHVPVASAVPDAAVMVTSGAAPVAAMMAASDAVSAAMGGGGAVSAAILVPSREGQPLVPLLRKIKKQQQPLSQNGDRVAAIDA